mmetsp:Transcript_23818/g.34800  ORF Transcript_23818/g.34800 Transcript_23818/m.34800 type:complete len:165 (-) Transcript_23818:215-709(-)|eukprot:CAMPEP_0195526706 /NCGR_PEP_ID=MMETSP0794_2-20130614/27933_1 /TAXON_ID=515487 /ORGANISM="Stephanopyxis turris, Strain CCMP 815" /LENGTH=164 /DNA_ID=CAMNT_0040657461 /DNA_START=212 /DNA_END=706 /DNA_ORIENTATION=+
MPDMIKDEENLEKANKSQPMVSPVRKELHSTDITEQQLEATEKTRLEMLQSTEAHQKQKREEVTNQKRTHVPEPVTPTNVEGQNGARSDAFSVAGHPENKRSVSNVSDESKTPGKKKRTGEKNPIPPISKKKDTKTSSIPQWVKVAIPGAIVAAIVAMKLLRRK